MLRWLSRLSTDSGFQLWSWSHGHKMEPPVGLYAGCGAYLRFSLSLSLCPPPWWCTHTLSLSLKKEKKKKKKKKSSNSYYKCEFCSILFKNYKMNAYIRQSKIWQLFPLCGILLLTNIFINAQLSANVTNTSAKELYNFSFRKFSSEKIFGRVKTKIINSSLLPYFAKLKKQ